MPHSDSNTYPDQAAGASFGASIRATSTFQAQQMPFPLVVSLEREPGQHIVGQNASIFVFDPYEFGSFEPLGGYALGGSVGAFVPVDYVGTRWANGTVAADACVTGFTCDALFLLRAACPNRAALGILDSCQRRLRRSSTRRSSRSRPLGRCLAPSAR